MWKSPLRAESAARAKSVEMIAQGRLRYRETILFFRAEGGIRDGTVTGVQTCALPIYRARALFRVLDILPHMHERGMLEDVERPELGPITVPTTPLRLHGSAKPPMMPSPKIGQHNDEIGRASCRERV